MRQARDPLRFFLLPRSRCLSPPPCFKSAVVSVDEDRATRTATGGADIGTGEGDERAVNTPDPSLERLPVWVTLGEAAFLTGLSEEDLRARVDSGALTVTAVRQRRGFPPLLMVRSTDLRRLGLLPSSEEAVPPGKEAPAERRAPWSRLARPVAGLWVATVAGAAALAVLLATLWGPRSEPTVRPSPRPAADSLIWTVRAGSQSHIALIVLPEKLDPVAVVVPAETLVDLPGSGLATVGQATDSGGLLLASVQTTMDRTVGHYLLSDGNHVADLVDGLGGIEVQLVGTVTWGGQTFGPGPVRLPGAPVAAYLEEALPEDAPFRWLVILAGLLSAPQAQTPWSGPLGETDDPARAGAILAAARGGQILKLPTVESELGLEVDRQSLDRLVEGRLGGFGRQLVRVAVLNGDGRPGIGARISEILAPAGFRVVTAQNISSHDVEHTQIAASTEDLLPLAEQAGRMLGVGEVFAGPQPTGIADLTIVVGHDFAAGSPAAIEPNSNSD
jgi:LytR cell envelope-related transcriptional attenuator